MTLSKERLEEMTSGDSSRLITVSEALAMARELRERRERDKQEPVAMRWRWKDDGLSEVGEWIYHPPKYFEQLNATDTRLCELLYAAPPAPVVPEEATPENIEIIASARRRDCAVFQWDEDQRNAAADSWNACRASALNQTHVKQPASDGQSFGNSEQLNCPVIPDGWQLVPVEPTEDMVIQGFESEPDEFFSKDEGWEAYQDMSGCEQAAHRAKLCWAAMLAAAPKQETNQ